MGTFSTMPVDVESLDFRSGMIGCLPCAPFPGKHRENFPAFSAHGEAMWGGSSRWGANIPVTLP